MEKIPQLKEIDINLGAIQAACEAGKNLYLVGRFGGFGGIFYSGHVLLSDAKIKSESIEGAGVFVLKVNKLDS